MDVRSIGKYRIVGKGANGSPNRKGNSGENRGVFAALPDGGGGVNKSDLPQIKTCSCVQHVIKSLEQLFVMLKMQMLGFQKTGSKRLRKRSHKSARSQGYLRKIRKACGKVLFGCKKNPSISCAAV